MESDLKRAYFADDNTTRERTEQTDFEYEFQSFFSTWFCQNLSTGALQIFLSYWESTDQLQFAVHFRKQPLTFLRISLPSEFLLLKKAFDVQNLSLIKCLTLAKKFNLNLFAKNIKDNQKTCELFHTSLSISTPYEADKKFLHATIKFWLLPMHSSFPFVCELQRAWNGNECDNIRWMYLALTFGQASPSAFSQGTKRRILIEAARERNEEVVLRILDSGFIADDPRRIQLDVLLPHPDPSRYQTPEIISVPYAHSALTLAELLVYWPTPEKKRLFWKELWIPFVTSFTAALGFWTFLGINQSSLLGYLIGTAVGLCSHSDLRGRIGYLLYSAFGNPVRAMNFFKLNETRSSAWQIFHFLQDMTRH